MNGSLTGKVALAAGASRNHELSRLLTLEQPHATGHRDYGEDPVAFFAPVFTQSKSIHY